MRSLLLLILIAMPLRAAEVVLLHFSDYHSHALPFHTDAGERGGIARAIGYLERGKQSGALVFSGGDTINKGAPAWSDKYGCVEWPWWNGIVDAAAFGNHDADYGKAAFETCRAAARYPILGANVSGLRRWTVVERNGLRIGVFALAGRDFPQLVKTPGFTFGDPIDAARDVVATLREKERVDAVVMIGHEQAGDDYALARSVPGIDVIFGSHSHLEQALTKIEGTETWFISPSQYLSFISRVVLRFDDRRLVSVTGELVPVDDRIPEKRSVARRVRRMQRALERDPRYRALFARIATMDAAVSSAELARRTLDVMREVTESDVALSTRSSFRLPLAPGELTEESLRASFPYDNEIVTCAMSGVQLQRVLNHSRSLAGSDSESYIAAPPSIDAAASYRVATTDYLAHVAYRDVFECDKKMSGLRVREEVRKSLTR